MAEAGARVGIIVAAGGTGSRFGRAEGKQLALLAGKPVVAWSIEALLSLRNVRELVIVCTPDRCVEHAGLLAGVSAPGVTMSVVPGGATRQESVARGLDALTPACEVVLVHDGARPLVTPGLAAALVDTLLGARDADGVIVGHPSVDTIKRTRATDEACVVVETPERSEFWAVQTPQVFRADALRNAYRAAAADGFVGTDDASLVERLGGTVVVLEGPRDNVKVTHAEDLMIAEAILKVRAEEAGA